MFVHLLRATQHVLTLILFPVQKLSLRYSVIQHKRSLLRRATHSAREIDAKDKARRQLIRHVLDESAALNDADAKTDAIRILSLVRAYKRAASKVIRNARKKAKLERAQLVAPDGQVEIIIEK